MFRMYDVKFSEIYYFNVVLHFSIKTSWYLPGSTNFPERKYFDFLYTHSASVVWKAHFISLVVNFAGGNVSIPSHYFKFEIDK